ncbi:alpha/beta fold hydrolase [Ktedonobacter racemifer]|uniref:Alpha/beta hydrolase fold protein n=1 Tax=Ktedonobacter racemifer DSM 44963 TaxID=485913 RepID=D6TQG9_KTERA|nr:alpha/beta hydrolase [Ktedonobacter racemifer]EFH87636.1 alpha/beta hydrolase fold protein [Ktedonobacter racemifer DSM 44963]
MPTHYLQVTDGIIAFDDQGQGPLVLCMPAGGDLRSEYRYLTPQLVAAGYRVVTMDMRGQGESSVNWLAYTDAALGSDMLALMKHLGTLPAFLIGTSKATGAALQASLQEPTLVRGLVLIGPFVAAPRSALLTKLTVSLLLAPLWGVAMFRSYFPRMYPKARPTDFEEHRRRVMAMLKEPGRLRALRQLFSESSGETYARHGEVQAPTLILMGSRDPDFKAPEQEALTLAGRLPHATVQIIEGAGHHLHVEEPEVVGQSILAFLETCQQSIASSLQEVR